MVGEVIRSGMDKKTAATFVRQRATENVGQEERSHFIEVVETEIMSLHEGNIARYRNRPSEYLAWRQKWE